MRPGEAGPEAHHEGERNMNPENIQTVVEIYVSSLKDRRNPHILNQKYTNLSEAGRADIELDVGCWFAGFSSGIKLVSSKPTTLPGLDAVLSAITKRFAEEGIAA
jgi:hypothetical protein